MQNERRPYAQRLNRDISEIFSIDFNCSSSNLIVVQSSDNLKDPGCLSLCIKIFEGPYRGGCFSFGLTIPDSYPFKAVDVWSKQPIWHPNIELTSGRVALPLEWSPVITLHSLALAVQMLMLEPSAENPLNLEAYSFYMSNPTAFDQNAQKSIQGGCIINGIQFNSVLIIHDLQHSTLTMCGNDSQNSDMMEGTTPPVSRSSTVNAAMVNHVKNNITAIGNIPKEKLRYHNLTSNTDQIICSNNPKSSGNSFLSASPASVQRNICSPINTHFASNNSTFDTSNSTIVENNSIFSPQRNSTDIFNAFSAINNTVLSPVSRKRGFNQQSSGGLSTDDMHVSLAEQLTLCGAGDGDVSKRMKR